MRVWVLSFENDDRTVKNREFWVSTAVDLAVSVVVGVAAAAVVGGVIAAFSITAPLWLAVAVTAGVGFGIGLVVDALHVPEILKSWLNNLLSKSDER